MKGSTGANGVRPQARDYTPLYDEARHELVFDFFVHDGGIASNWALEAKVGDKLTIGGPRGSLVVRKITPGSCTCAMSPGCLRCVVV
jgi:ferric-chelate reductase (NADPH)